MKATTDREDTHWPLPYVLDYPNRAAKTALFKYGFEAPQSPQQVRSSGVVSFPRVNQILLVLPEGARRDKLHPWHLSPIGHQASVAQICKASTWSSLHTYTKFYHMDVRTAEDTAFGHSVLQAAV